MCQKGSYFLFLGTFLGTFLRYFLGTFLGIFNRITRWGNPLKRSGVDRCAKSSCIGEKYYQFTEHYTMSP